MEKLDGVANTLYVPLYGRIYVSKKFPEYFYDEMALKIEEKDVEPIIELLTSLGEIAYEIGHIEKGDHSLCLK